MRPRFIRTDVVPTAGIHITVYFIYHFRFSRTINIFFNLNYKLMAPLFMSYFQE